MSPDNLPQQLQLDYLPQKTREGRFSNSLGNLPENKIRLVNPATGQTWGFVVIDDTTRGPGLGGIRIAPDLNLEEVARLARAMTLKNSAACLPFGGGKSGIIADPRILDSSPDLKKKLIDLFAEAIYPESRYISAPDMGSNERDIQRIYDFNSKKSGTGVHSRGGAGRLPENGGIPIDDWGLTAHGLFAAAQTMENLEGGLPIKNARVIIQGYGNVGAWTATKLFQAGAIITGASDIHAAIWNPQGLNVDELNKVRKGPNGLQSYSRPVDRRFGPDRLDWLLEGPCEILVPAARPDAITARNADRIQCRMILQGANAPSNKMTEYYLQNRKNILSLSDFIVNVGGVVGCAVELKMTGQENFKNRVLDKGIKIYTDELIYDIVARNVREIHQRLSIGKNGDRTFREEALELAEERLRSNSKEYWV